MTSTKSLSEQIEERIRSIPASNPGYMEVAPRTIGNLLSPELIHKISETAAKEAADTLDAKDRRFKQLLDTFSELQAAAQKVMDETDRIHDSEPWPVKYCAPYAAIVELRQLLAKQYGLRG